MVTRDAASMDRLPEILTCSLFLAPLLALLKQAAKWWAVLWTHLHVRELRVALATSEQESKPFNHVVLETDPSLPVFKWNPNPCWFLDGIFMKTLKQRSQLSHAQIPYPQKSWAYKYLVLSCFVVIGQSANTVCLHILITFNKILYNTKAQFSDILMHIVF